MPPRFTGPSLATSGAARGDVRGDFNDSGKGREGPSVSHCLGGTKSSWLKIHIQAGDWEKCLCEKGSKAQVGLQEMSYAS